MRPALQGALHAMSEVTLNRKVVPSLYCVTVVRFVIILIKFYVYMYVCMYVCMPSCGVPYYEKTVLRLRILRNVQTLS